MKHLLFAVALAAVSSAFAGQSAERTQQPAPERILKSDGFVARCAYPMCGGKL